MTTPTYSVVIPVFNEAAGLAALRERVTALIDRLDAPAEVILVDDGSHDGSFEICCRLRDVDERFKAVRLSRNFGHQTAITAGMDLAGGDAIVVMDADLQDPPEVVLEMAAKWREGYEVVYGVRTDRTSDTFFKRATAGLFYRGLRRLTDVDIPLDVGDFRLIDRRALGAVQAMREGSRFVRGMVASVGFRQTGVPYRRDPRFAGETKYPLRKMVRLAADGVIGFSRLPLRLALQTGFVVAGLSVLGGFLALLMKVIGVFTVPGWSSLIFVICLLGGIQLTVTGLVGEYLGRTYEESLGRPIYIVSDLAGVEAPVGGVARAVIAPPRPALVDLTASRFDGSRSGGARPADPHSDDFDVPSLVRTGKKENS
jgi:glycosyltransferase involved in cell wall biosynthesis